MVIRVAPDLADGGFRWSAYAGDQPAGSLRALLLPNQCSMLRFHQCHPEAYRPLLAAARPSLTGQVQVRVAEADQAERDRLTGLGFVVWRQEHVYEIPVSAVPIASAEGAPTLLSAADADLDRLRGLDEQLRDEIPGSAGWRWRPGEFREETFSDGFNPATYLVAAEAASGRYIGLIRIWLREGGARLGCLGVLPAYRGTRVTVALLTRAAAALRERAVATVTTEIDVANRAANRVARRAGAVRIDGGSYLRWQRPELVAP